MEHLSQKESLALTFVGWDSWSRPVYKSDHGNLFVDVDPRPDRLPDICSKCCNDFDGEPDTPIAEDMEIMFIPARMTW